LEILIADAQLAATRESGAQIAFMNSGGLRADLVPAADGSVSFGAIYAVQPFGNTMVGEELHRPTDQGPSSTSNGRADRTRSCGRTSCCLRPASLIPTTFARPGSGSLDGTADRRAAAGRSALPRPPFPISSPGAGDNFHDSGRRDQVGGAQDIDALGSLSAANPPPRAPPHQRIAEPDAASAEPAFDPP
jgi:5'-nucleotidase